MTNNDEEIMLEKMSYIYYLLGFYKDMDSDQLDNGNKVNIMSPNYT